MSSLNFYTQLNKELSNVEKEFRTNAEKYQGLIDYDEERQYLMNLIDSTSANEVCFPGMIASAFLNIAKFGLTICPDKQLAFVIPQFDPTNGFRALFYIGYKGYLKLGSLNPYIQITTADIIYSNDTFQFNGINNRVTHSTQSLSTNMRGAMAGGYCTTELVDGAVVTTTMSPEEVMEIETSCKTNPHSFWHSAFVDELRKKTLIRRHWKTLVSIVDGAFEDEFTNNLNLLEMNS
ncbi:recombinase RecT (plasmid) [Psychrobium sp. nBUS_13]|uniref:recombinase RecT n=1 Tax=Psychrobium sp. nBUS_13 TaxID=3395319 RepID=UPI003EB9BB21